MLDFITRGIVIINYMLRKDPSLWNILASVTKMYRPTSTIQTPKPGKVQGQYVAYCIIILCSNYRCQ